MANASVQGALLTAGARAAPAAGRAGLSLTPLLRAYARNRLDQLAREDAALAQRRQLASLVARAAGTKFGKHHDFAAIRTVADYQKRVPLRTYGQLWDEYWRAASPISSTSPGRAGCPTSPSPRAPRAGR
jgi:hypothetical protein